MAPLVLYIERKGVKMRFSNVDSSIMLDTLGVWDQFDDLDPCNVYFGVSFSKEDDGEEPKYSLGLEIDVDNGKDGFDACSYATGSDIQQVVESVVTEIKEDIDKKTEESAESGEDFILRELDALRAENETLKAKLKMDPIIGGKLGKKKEEKPTNQVQAKWLYEPPYPLTRMDWWW